MIRRAATALVATAVTITSYSAHAGVEESCVTAANESEALRKDVSKLTRARERLRVCAADDCPGPIRDECRKVLSEVEADIPTVVLLAEDENGSQTFEVKVIVDGVPLATDVLDGKPVSLDAGAHTFRFVRRGGEAIEVRAVLRASLKNAEVIARFPRAVSPVAVPVTEPASRVAPPPGAEESKSSSLLPTAGLIAGGVGVVGLGLGVFFGLRASSLQSDAGCQDNRCADETRADKIRDAQSAATISTVSFIAGGVLAVGGLSLVLFAPKSHVSARVEPMLGPSVAGITLRGVSF